jgi:hypothetical protein
MKSSRADRHNNQQRKPNQAKVAEDAHVVGQRL